MGIFSSILRGVNRNRTRPLNILTAPTHEAYETGLCRTGHNFFALRHQSFKDWNCTYRPVPYNYQLLDGSDRQIRGDMQFDLVLNQNKFGQYQVLSEYAKRLNCPLVSLEHTLPVPEWSERQRDAVRNMRGDINVFISEFSVGEWRFEADDPSVRVVHHGIDTDHFNGWKGGDGKILTVVNDWRNREWCCGFELWERITKGLPTNPWGATPGLSKPTRDTDHLRDLYRGASVFLNTSLVSPVPTVLLEAMACGCPVVTTSNCMLPDIVQDGINGYITNDESEMRQRLNELLADPVKGAELGRNARRTVEDMFSEHGFVERWNEIFREAVDRPALTWLRPTTTNPS